MYDGTLRADWKALITLQQMIVLCDPHGVVDMTPHAIHGRTGIPLDIIEHGISILESPDPHSRSTELDGRRIVRLEDSRQWGWRVVNYLYYRNLASAEDKRSKDKARVAERRAADRRDMSHGVADCSGVSPKVANVAQVEEEAEVEVKEEVEAKETPIINKTPTASAKTADTAAVERKRRTDEPLPTHATWSTYAYAYGARYAVQPVRNAKINSQIVQLVKRLGADEAPAVAAFYVRHNNALYVRANHCVDLLLRDCEGLHTQWANGRTVTDTEARQTDRKQNNLGIAERLIAKERGNE